MYGFIYITTNKINNKKYIGKCSLNKKNAKEYLGSGIYLNRAIKKYGKENFYRDIIDYSETKNILNEKEKYYINLYNACKSDDFYNIASGGDGGDVISGYSLDEKTLLSEKLSKIRKGNVNIGNKNGKSRKVICLNTMMIFDCIIDASKYYNISFDGIQQCCSNASKLKTCGFHPETGDRLIWKYYDEKEEYEYIKFINKRKTKCVYCLTTGEYFESSEIAAEKYNLKKDSIRECCLGRQKTAGVCPISNKKLSWEYSLNIIKQN